MAQNEQTKDQKINYYDRLMHDPRMREGLKACLNCGICTGVCPAAEFYDYDPRKIVTIVQSKDNDAIENLLKSETIWYCGECMSCRPRCPRYNTPGYIIQSLRRLSQELGFFTNSEKGRQQLAIKRSIGENILKTGYCLRPELIDPALHPEQGPVWKWAVEHAEDVWGMFSENFNKAGPGALRRLDHKTMEEMRAIFEVSGGNAFFKNIEECSDKKAREMGYENGADYQYFLDTFQKNSKEEQDEE